MMESEPVNNTGGNMAPSMAMQNSMMAGPLMASAMMPGQLMMAASNPYLNPMHPLHPFNHGFSVSHHYMTPQGMMTLHGQSGFSNEGIHPGNVQVPSHCSNVKKQALAIANTVMKKQNAIVFKKVMSYLLKSKYLIGMTEIKLTRMLRRNIFGIMKGYSTLGDEHVEFVGDGMEDDDLSGNSSIASLESHQDSDMGVYADSPSEQLEQISNHLNRI